MISRSIVSCIIWTFYTCGASMTLGSLIMCVMLNFKCCGHFSKYSMFGICHMIAFLITWLAEITDLQLARLARQPPFPSIFLYSKYGCTTSTITWKKPASWLIFIVKLSNILMLVRWNTIVLLISLQCKHQSYLEICNNYHNLNIWPWHKFRVHICE